MSLIHNERIKLLATTLNNVGIATVVTGVVGPSVGFIYGIGQPVTTLRLVIAVATWLAIGTGLHLVSARLLRRLVE